MHLCRFDDDHLGVVADGHVFDVSEALKALPRSSWPAVPGDPLIRSLDRVVEAAATLMKSAPARPIGQVALHSPVTQPSKLMAAPANYGLHVQIDAKDPGIDHGHHRKLLEGVARPAETFGLFLKANSALAGPAEGIELEWLDRRNDHEVELAVVIGKTARHVSASRALDYVAGYMIGLDITVRGVEDRSFRKSADSYAILGPWLTTADVIGDPSDLEIWLDVNGEPRQRTSTSAMTVDVPQLIELASSAYTLHPGDVIFTGTPEGVGPLKAGDRIHAGCSKLGEMFIDVRAARRT